MKLATELEQKFNVQNYRDLKIFPKFLQIETSSICNAKCTMCTIDEWQREIRLMKDELFNKIINELKEYASHINTVTIQLDGEPLLDTKLEERIKSLKDIGIKRVVFSTNGSLMTISRAKKILEAGTDEIYFSMDSIRKDIYEIIRKGLSFNTVLENIENFIAIRDKFYPHTKIRIRMVIMDINQDEVEDFKSFWKDRLKESDEIYAKHEHSWGNQKQTSHNAEIEDLNTIPCYPLWSSLIILSDGRVPLCCADFNANHLLGNIHNNSIYEVWNSEKFNSYRNKHEKLARNSLSMCQNCTLWID